MLCSWWYFENPNFQFWFFCLFFPDPDLISSSFFFIFYINTPKFMGLNEKKILLAPRITVQSSHFFKKYIKGNLWPQNQSKHQTAFCIAWPKSKGEIFSCGQKQGEQEIAWVTMRTSMACGLTAVHKYILFFLFIFNLFHRPCTHCSQAPSLLLCCLYCFAVQLSKKKEYKQTFFFF